MALWEKIKDRWLTWRTGKDLQQRTWEAWLDDTIYRPAGTVEGYFFNFKHIIEVDPAKVFDHVDPFGWSYVKDFQQYAYPNRELGNNTLCDWFRCIKDEHDGRWHINEIGGGDHLFAATNNDYDAIMIALKYA